MEMDDDLDVSITVLEEAFNVMGSVDELTELESPILLVLEAPEIGEAVDLDVDAKKLIELSL